jgi:hypothetical protein
MMQPGPLFDAPGIDALHSKWHSYIPPILPKERSRPIALFLESQKTYIDRLDGETREIVVKLIGPQWDEAILRAIARSLAASPMFDLFSVQPVVAEEAKIAFLDITDKVSAVDRMADLLKDTQVAEESSEIPEIMLEIKLEPVTAKQVPLPARFTATQSVTEAVGAQAGVEALQLVFDEALGGVLRTAIAKALVEADGVEPVSQDVRAGTDRGQDIQKMANHVYRRSLRGPANRIVANPKCLSSVDSTRYRYHGDPLFPEDKILGIYQGPSLLDAALVWAPFHFVFLPDEEAENTVDADFVVKRDVLRLAIRHSITVVDRRKLAVLGF